MEEVLDVYERPYDVDNPVICLDESPHQLIGEIRLGFTDEKGVEHIDYGYKREGVAEIFMLAEPKAGRREISIADTHDRLQWAKTICYLCEELYPDARRITLVQDNLTAHKKSALYELVEPQRARNILKRMEFIWTPKHGSWLNIAEIELSLLKRIGLKNRIASKEELQKQINAYLKQRNHKDTKVEWQFTTQKARIKLKRLYPK